MPDGIDVPELAHTPPSEPMAPDPVTEPEMPDGPRVKRKYRKRAGRDFAGEYEQRKARAKTDPAPAAEVGPGPSPQEVEALAVALAMAFDFTFGAIAVSRGEHWRLKPEGAQTMGRAWALAVAPYMQYVAPALPILGAIVATYGEIAPRLEIDNQNKRLTVAPPSVPVPTPPVDPAPLELVADAATPKRSSRKEPNP